MRTHLRLFACAVAIASTGGVARAAEHDKDPCITAYEETQLRRKDGKLVEANREAAICARAECPAVLAKDCTKWHAELENAIPTVVLDARSASGAELTSVRVTIDGVVVAEKLDGKALHVDPGSHTFRFESAGHAAVDRVVVVRESEKNRKIAVALAAEPGAPAEPSRPVPVGVWLFGGASLVALVVSSVFAIDGIAKKSDLDGCKPHCPAGDVDAMNASFTVADVALGAGVALGLAAVWLYVTRPKTEPSTTTAVLPWVDKRGVGAAATIPF